MISGAAYREGVARTDNGAVYVTTTTPSPKVGRRGSGLSPSGKVMNDNGAIWVVYV